MPLANNPLFALQDNLAALLGADPYFSGVPILTEKLADLEAQIESKLINTGGFGLVITTARGQRHGAPDATETLPLVMTEELAITVIHSPLMDATRRALDGVYAVMRTVNAAAAVDDGLCWRVLGHDYREDAPAGVITHSIRVSALMLL